MPSIAAEAEFKKLLSVAGCTLQLEYVMTLCAYTYICLLVIFVAGPKLNIS